MNMVDQMEYSEHGIPLWDGQLMDVPARYQVSLRARKGSDESILDGSRWRHGFDTVQYLRRRARFIAAIIAFAGYYLFLQGWNPVISFALFFVGFLVTCARARVN
jgi:hypothetical protein